MASSRNATEIQWSASGSVSISASSNATSDVFTFNAEDWDASITVKADNDGTAASGDTIDCYLLWSYDGTNFDTVEHAQHLGRLNTYASDTPGEDPVQRTWQIPTAAAAFKLYTVNNAGSNSITVTADVVTHRPQ